MAEKFLLGRRVRTLAYSHTKEAYLKHIEGLAGQVVATFLVIAIRASTGGGLDIVIKEFPTWGAVVAANLGWLLLLFGWHLWLAPYELALQALENAKTIAAPQIAGHSEQVQKAPTNFSALRARDWWKVSDFAGLLAFLDTSGQGTASAHLAWEAAILEAMGNNRLRYKRTPSRRLDGYLPPNQTTELMRLDAIAWANDRGFDMSQLN